MDGALTWVNAGLILEGHGGRFAEVLERPGFDLPVVAIRFDQIVVLVTPDAFSSDVGHMSGSFLGGGL
jgi:hypothetical protein